MNPIQVSIYKHIGERKNPLNSRVAVYIPSYTQSGDKLTRAEHQGGLEAWKRLFGNTFGGFTVQEAKGGYTMRNEVFEEDITIIYAYGSEKDVAHHCRKILTAAQKMCARLQQETVALEIGGEVLLL